MVFDTKHKSFGENVTGLLRLIQLRGGCGGWVGVGGLDIVQITDTKKDITKNRVLKKY